MTGYRSCFRLIQHDSHGMSHSLNLISSIREGGERGSHPGRSPAFGPDQFCNHAKTTDTLIQTVAEPTPWPMSIRHDSHDMLCLASVHRSVGETLLKSQSARKESEDHLYSDRVTFANQASRA